MKQHPKIQVEGTANAIKDHFIPKDGNVTEFSFHFTIPPSSNYKASYIKDTKGNWNLENCEMVEN